MMTQRLSPKNKLKKKKKKKKPITYIGLDWQTMALCKLLES